MTIVADIMDAYRHDRREFLVRLAEWYENALLANDREVIEYLDSLAMTEEEQAIIEEVEDAFEEAEDFSGGYFDRVMDRAEAIYTAGPPMF